jgi:hypothetical protein
LVLTALQLFALLGIATIILLGIFFLLGALGWG